MFAFQKYACACFSLSLLLCIFSLSLGAKTFFGTPGLSHQINKLLSPTEVVLGSVSSNLALGPILYHQILKMTCIIKFDPWAFGTIL